MIKKQLAALCACMVLTLTSCSGNDNYTDIEIHNENSSRWELIDEESFDFTVNISGFYDENHALCVGYGGEIRYFDAEASEWLNAENYSMCQFGMDIVNGTTCYTCGNSAYVTKSTDGGKIFEEAAMFGDFEPNHCQLMSFCDENNGMIASGKRLAVTADGAATWNELDIPFEITAIRMVTQSEFYCIAKGLIMYKTADGGLTWESTPLNLPLGNEYIDFIQNFALSVDGKDEFTVFCVGLRDRELKSYSTIDGWKSCFENLIPEMYANVISLYLNPHGNILTVTDLDRNSITALKKQKE